jgi:hypothetical protein
MGPSACIRVAEIMSGRANSQPGLAETCKDPAHKAEARAREGVSSGARALMSHEEGVMPSAETLEVSPTVDNARGGRRSPGYSAVAAAGRGGDMARGSPSPKSSRVWTMSRPGYGSCCRDEGTGKPSTQRVYASQHLGLGAAGQARDPTNEWSAEIRTGLGQSDRPGSPRGFRNRGQSETCPRASRAELLSRQPHARVERGMGQRASAARRP